MSDDGLNKLPMIAGLWVGSDLSWLEQVVIQSYLDRGHPFTLYTVGDIGGVPSGVDVRNADEIYGPPPFDISDNDRLRVAVYSDIFRLHLMSKTDFIWSDLDAYCVRSFEGLGDHVFGLNQKGIVPTGIMKVPADSETLALMLDFVTLPNPVQPWRGSRLHRESAERVKAGKIWGIEDLPWGCSGPKGFTHFLKETGEIELAQESDVFYPQRPDELRQLLLAGVPVTEIEKPSTKSVHIYGHQKKLLAIENRGLPPAGSYLDRICDRHGIHADQAPIPRLVWM